MDGMMDAASSTSYSVGESQAYLQYITYCTVHCAVSQPHTKEEKEDQFHGEAQSTECSVLVSIACNTREHF